MPLYPAIAILFAVLSYFFWPHALKRTYSFRQNEVELSVIREHLLQGRDLALLPGFLDLLRQHSKMEFMLPGIAPLRWEADSRLIEHAVGFEGNVIYLATRQTKGYPSTCQTYRLFISSKEGWLEKPPREGMAIKWFELKNGPEEAKPFPLSTTVAYPLQVTPSRFNINEQLSYCKTK